MRMVSVRSVIAIAIKAVHIVIIRYKNEMYKLNGQTHCEKQKIQQGRSK